MKAKPHFLAFFIKILTKNYKMKMVKTLKNHHEKLKKL